MSEHRPQERGRLIHKPTRSHAHCSTCEPTPKGRVSAEELWRRMSERDGNGFVRVAEGTVSGSEEQESDG